MSRTRFLAAALALLAIVGLAALLWWQPSPAVDPIGPARPDVPLDLPVPVQGTVIAAATTAAEPNLPPERASAVVAAVADERASLLEVIVDQIEGGSAVRLPFVEVALALDGQATGWNARTNARGVATFELAGADGRTGVVRCALGAAAQVELSAAVTTRVTLSVRPRVIVQGTVVDPTGRGVADASLLLLPWPVDEDDVPAIARVGRSRADGSFRIGLASGGRFGAHHRAYGPSGMFAVRAAGTDASPPIVTLQLALLTSGAAAAGTVRDAQGALIAGAEIELRSSGAAPRGADLRGPPQRVRTAKDGSFAVTGLVPGTIEWSVRATGHGRLAGSVPIGAGECARLPLQLPAACTLHGTVKSTDGAPVAGAPGVAGTPGMFLAAATKTDGTGAYRLVDLAPGSTPLAARGSRAAGVLGRAAATQDLVAGDANEWNVVLGAAGDELRGLVVDDGGAPLGGWRVVARSSGATRAATTDADGTFALAAVPEPRVDLRAWAPQRSLAHFADVVMRGVARDSRSVRLVVPRDRFGRIEGIVEGQQRLAVPASIVCWHHERGEQVRFVATADGVLRLHEVPAGTVDLVLEHPGHAAAARRDIVVAASSVVDLGTIVLGACGTLTGSVRGPYGRSPEQCQLTIADTEARLQADYNAGTYRFAGVPVGEHVLQVQGGGVAAATFTVVIEANVEKVHDIELQAGVRRTIRVDAPRDGPPSVSLALRPIVQNAGTPRAGGHRPVWMATAAVERGSGSVASAAFVAYLAPGEYEAIAWNRDKWEARRRVTFAIGDESEIRLELAKN